jgi:hypothetical protein
VRGQARQGWCNQIHLLDLKARNAKLVERVPSFILEEVKAKVAAIREIEPED